MANRIFTCKIFDKSIFDTGECAPTTMADSNWLQFQLRWINHYKVWQAEDNRRKWNEYLYTLLFTIIAEES